MLFKTIVILLSCAFAPGLSYETSPHQKSRVLSSRNETAVRLLYEYPLGTFIESIAIRPNGELLMTLPYNSSVHSIDPLHSNYTPTVVHNFDGLTIFGMTEYERDVYAVNGGRFSSSTGPVAGTYRVDSLNLTQTMATSSTIANISSGQFLNGMTSLPRWGVGPRNLLVNDVAAGIVYNLDPVSGKYFIAINNTYTQAHEHPNLGAVGVNGIKIGDGMVYLTNTGLGMLVRFPIHENGTEVAGGAVEILSHEANSTWFYDDFALRDTIAYVTTGSGNSIERVFAPAVGSQGPIPTEIVVGSLNSTTVAGPTAAAFGRTPWDSHILYVTTSGASNVPVDGRITIGAQVLAIDTTLCSWG
ncbi:putative six-bladed beta-propeller -like protein [Botrytis cinerea BcDW1]|uniref:Putative six-bladed beta-propeller-like protein n=1 Tax=Botryotinia fuckeliana (strain BcDW1) TaxID=1290391 RepID=M7U564_BOTF1|nr:putative six-bladed beta-propeller -like protein [Botrytis cinerea BcDW1]